MFGVHVVCQFNVMQFTPMYISDEMITCHGEQGRILFPVKCLPTLGFPILANDEHYALWLLHVIYKAVLLLFSSLTI